METKTDTFYTLETVDGLPLFIDQTENHSNNCCGEYTYRLVDKNWGNLELYRVDDLKTATFVRSNSTEWYNTSESHPSHNYDDDELVVVKKTIVTHTESEIVELISYGDPENIKKFIHMTYGAKEYHNSHDDLVKMADSYISGRRNMHTDMFDRYHNFLLSFHAADEIATPHLLTFDDGQRLYISKHVLDTALAKFKTKAMYVIALPSGLVRAHDGGENTVIVAENTGMVGTENTVTRYGEITK